MNICVLEYSKINALSDGAINLVSDLKENSLYVNSVNLISDLSTINNELNSENVYLLYLNENDYYNAKNLLKDYLYSNDYYAINGSKLYLISPTVNYFNNLNAIVLALKTPFTTYKLFDVNLINLKNYLSDTSVKFKTFTNGLDTKVCFDLTSLTEDSKWEFLKNFNVKFSDYIYAESDASLECQLVKILSLRGLKISTAESFTSGALASTITSVSGASKVFYEGIVAYNENSKIDRLNVQESTVRYKRPVSQETAYEMCLGLLNKGVDLAVSTTGIAGPNSDESGFPVGLVYIGIGTKQKIAVYKFSFSGSRKDVNNKGVKQALFMAIKALRNGSFDI